MKTKVNRAYQLSVLLLHSKKKPYSEIQEHDVVLTTYGSLSAELRRYKIHIEQRKASAQYREEDDLDLAQKCPLLHPLSKFHRVILDEAQYIKNKETQSSLAVHQLNATYRWCLTGTPMMNSILELYPLLRFLRVKPYCDLNTFNNVRHMYIH